MKIEEEFKKNGYFWLVDKPENQLPGLLTVSEDGEVNLEIVGLLDDFNVVTKQEPKAKFRLAGLIDSNYVTLENCYYNNSNVQLVNQKLSKCNIYAEYLLVGLGFEEAEEIAFDYFEFTFDGLVSWLDKSCGELSLSNNYESGVLTFSRNNSLQYLFGKDKLEICFYNSHPMGVNSTGFNLKQQAFIKISSSDTKKSLEDIRKIILKIYNLFCLSINKSSSLTSLACYNNDIVRNDESKRPVAVRVYFSSSCYSKLKPEIHWHTNLFSFHEVENSFNTLLANWLNGYEIYEPSLTLYFANKRPALKRYVEDHFLYMVHALESLHRRVSNETEMPIDEFKKLFKEITESVDKKYKQLISERLNYGNELSLLKRLRKIHQTLTEYGVILNSYEDDFKKIKDTRNYLTHYDSKLKNKKSTLSEMIILTGKMEALFQLYLLKELGFTAVEIQNKITNGHNQLKHKLGLN